MPRRVPGARVGMCGLYGLDGCGNATRIYVDADAYRGSSTRPRLRIGAPRGATVDHEPYTGRTPRSGGHVDQLRRDAVRTPRPRRTVSAGPGGEHRRLAGSGWPEESSTRIDGRRPAQR